MQAGRRVVLSAVSVSLFAGWLVAEGSHATDIPSTLKEIQEGVQHLSQEVKALQSAVKELAYVSKHGGISLPEPSVTSLSPKSNLERAHEAYNRGSASEKLKIYLAAVEAFSDAIRLDPGDDAAFLRRGSCYLQLGELGSALTDLNQALKLQPNNSRSYGTRAEIEARMGQGTNALADVNQALSRDPKYTEALLLRGDLYQQAGDASKAIDDFTSVISMTPSSEKAYLKRSEAFLSTGQFGPALTDCNQVVKNNGASASGYLCRAESELRNGAADLAIADVNRAAASEDFPVVKALLTSVSGVLNEQLAARQVANRELARQALEAKLGAVHPSIPSSEPKPEAVNPVISVPAAPASGPGATPPAAAAPTPAVPKPVEPQVSRQPPLQQHLHQTSPTKPVDPSAAKNARESDRQGRRLVEASQLEPALVAFTRAIEFDPKLASAYNGRGYVYLRLRQPDRALTDFSEAIRLNPAYSNALHNRAVTRRLLGDPRGAAEDDQSFNEIKQHVAGNAASTAFERRP